MSENGLPPGELQRKLAAKGASDSCPMCKTEQWGLLHDRREKVKFPIVEDIWPEVYGLICLNCGFVRWHVADIVEAPTVRSVE
jgi:hypothetical protein